MTTTYIQMIQKRIRELESKISESNQDLRDLQQELQRLKSIEFEESIRQDNEVQLLKG